jgi:hypothetical protein
MTKDQILALVDELQEGGATVIISLNIALDAPGEPAPVPTPAPLPAGVLAIITKDPRANAFCVKTTNQAGKPVMDVYPSSGSPVEARIQFNKGAVIAVAPDKVHGDGGVDYHRLMGTYGASKPLYMRDEDLRF